MGDLYVSMTTSLDGYVTDAHGRFDFTEPDAEVHAFINDLQRTTGTLLLGRRLYDVLTYWEEPTPEIEESPITLDFHHIWKATRKVVYSTSLDAVATENTTIERVFDPEKIADLVGRSDSDVEIGGPTLAAHAFRAGLVSEIRQFIVPRVIGDGLRLLPAGYDAQLELIEQTTFDNGTVYVRYAVS